MFSPNLRVLFCSSSFWLNRSFNFWIRFNISHFLFEFLIDESVMYFLVRFTFDFSCFRSFDSFSFRFQFLVFDLHSIIASWFSEFDMVMCFRFHFGGSHLVCILDLAIIFWILLLLPLIEIGWFVAEFHHRLGCYFEFRVWRHRRWLVSAYRCFVWRLQQLKIVDSKDLFTAHWISFGHFWNCWALLGLCFCCNCDSSAA